MRVAVYKNLTTGLWSVTDVKVLKNGGERKGKLIDSVTDIRLTDVHMVLSSDKSFDRVQGQINNPAISASREVIAYAIGTVAVSDDTNGFTRFSYNPKGANTFYDSETNNVTPMAFDAAWFNTEGAHYK